MSILDEIPALQSVVAQVAEVAGVLWQKGWAERNGGNITLNITEHIPSDYLPHYLTESIALNQVLPHIAGQWFYCKGTGMRMRDLAREPMKNGSVIRISEDGISYRIVADKVVMPTSELPSHLMVHDYLVESRCGYTATVHTHPIELVAMSHIRAFLDSQRLTKTLWSMIPETLAFAPLGLGVVPYDVPGSQDLAKATLQMVQDYDVTLWEKHGVFAVGKDVMDAFDQIDVLNKAAQIYMSCKNMGHEPEGMTEQQMRTVQQIFHLPTHR